MFRIAFARPYILPVGWLRVHCQNTISFKHSAFIRKKNSFSSNGWNVERLRVISRRDNRAMKFYIHAWQQSIEILLCILANMWSDSVKTLAKHASVCRKTTVINRNPRRISTILGFLKQNISKYRQFWHVFIKVMSCELNHHANAALNIQNILTCKIVPENWLKLLLYAPSFILNYPKWFEMVWLLFST